MWYFQDQDPPVSSSSGESRTHTNSESSVEVLSDPDDVASVLKGLHRKLQGRSIIPQGSNLLI